MLEISADKVAHVIVRSRELDGKVAAWDDSSMLDMDDMNSDTILEDLPGDATRHELRAFLQSLNSDEQASLVALLWIGRGTYAPEEVIEAIATAKSEHATNATRYLLEQPLLPDYLEDGLEQMGISVEEVTGRLLKRF